MSFLVPQEFKDAAGEIARTAQQAQVTLAALHAFLRRADRIAEKVERALDALTAAVTDDPHP